MKELLQKQRPDQKAEEKETLKKDSLFILLKSVNTIIKPSLKSLDLDT